MILSDKQLKKFSNKTIMDDTSVSKVDVIHRKILKFILGLSKSCTNVAMYGETGEVPLSLKGYRLTLNYWHKVSTLPDTYLVKKALLENIELHTNWITTIEKLIGVFNLADKFGNHDIFKKVTKCEIDKAYLDYWKTQLIRPDLTKLDFYREIKNDFTMENYLHIDNFENRKLIAKFRCSDHCLEIERGRHRRIPRTERICRLCDKGLVETEEHFLMKCDKYDLLKRQYNITDFTTAHELVLNVEQAKLGKYLSNAFTLRAETLIHTLET